MISDDDHLDMTSGWSIQGLCVRWDMTRLGNSCTKLLLGNKSAGEQVELIPIFSPGVG